MKKLVSEEKTFCDLCGEPAQAECIICGNDICFKHRISLAVEAMLYRTPGVRAWLCPPDAKPLLPFLKGLVGKSTSKNAGQNWEYNEARLAEVITLIEAS